MRRFSNPSLAEYRHKAIAWAKQVLADETAVILDTETTGLDNSAEIIEIAIISTQGQPLLDTLVKPKGKIPIDAYEIHGIGSSAVKHAPIWPNIDDRVNEIIKNASRVVIYNAGYDTRLLRQTRQLYNLPPPDMALPPYECAMKRYAEFYGDWRGSQRGFRWQPLTGGNHRALGDCLATLKVLQQMAQAGIDQEGQRL
jgi:DNA polymerase-3 subunit epsilon